jgi:vancomycin permeability regulator SanA
MPGVVRELLWALLYAVLSLPVAYLITTIVMSWANRGYVKVDPVRLRRIAVSLAVLVFVATFLIQKFRG